MCKVFSGFTSENELVYWSPGETNSHEDLADLLGVNRDPRLRVQWEFYPPKGEWDQPEKYELHTDQDCIPDWWDAERQEKVATELRKRVGRMILRDKRLILAGGPWILADGFETKRTVNAVIIAVVGEVSAGNVYGTCTVGNVSGTCTVGNVYGTGSVKVGNVYVTGSVKVGNVSGTGLMQHGKIENTALVTVGGKQLKK